MLVPSSYHEYLSLGLGHSPWLRQGENFSKEVLPEKLEFLTLVQVKANHSLAWLLQLWGFPPFNSVGNPTQNPLFQSLSVPPRMHLCKRPKVVSGLMGWLQVEERIFTVL